MSAYVPWVLLSCALLAAGACAFVVARSGVARRHALGFAVIACAALLLFRGLQLIGPFHILLCYGVIVTICYLTIYYRAFVIYSDPAQHDHCGAARTMRVVFVVPVFNEQHMIGRCIRSVRAAAEHARDVAETTIIVVNDASTDATAQQLEAFHDDRQIRVVHLATNAGKKAAIATAMCGGRNWLEGFREFTRACGREPLPTRADYEACLAALARVGCEPVEADLYFHTDSDCVVSESYIRDMIRAFRSDADIAAVSGHCDVYLEPGRTPSKWTRLQALWCTGQFAIRKAAESPYVFCVSGPCAAFRSEAIMRHLPRWVHDEFAGRPYRGATDRMITLLVLRDGWKAVYSQSARVWTVVPATYQELRDQWTRWKQNFWRMFVPFCQFAHRLPLWSAVLGYGRIALTVLAPCMVVYHLAIVVNGYFALGLFYLAGIGAMGMLMGIATIAKTPPERRERNSYFWFRPLLSLVSSLCGSMLTVRALCRTLSGRFSWRERRKHVGREWGRWVVTFESWVLAIIMVLIIAFRFTGLFRFP